MIKYTNEYQIKARELIRDPSKRYVLIMGGTGGGKSFVIMDTIIDRALRAPGSRHLCLRSTNVDVETLLFDQTLRDVLNKKFPIQNGEKGDTAFEFWREQHRIKLQPATLMLPNGSTIMFRGLDDNKIDRILGADVSTVFINECSLVHDYAVVRQINTRIRQKVMTIKGDTLKPKFIFDCNPASEKHWTHAAFHEGLEPRTRLPHKNPEAYGMLVIPPESNRENLADGYLEEIANGASYIEYMRHVKGWWYKEVENPMFSMDDITKARLAPRLPHDCDDLVRIEVAVDPAITAKKGSDETGIIVLGVDADDHAYVLEDLSGVYQPFQWGQIAVEAFHRWKANAIVAERNQGGDMVESNLRTTDPSVPVKLIWASRGKDIRAEGAATAYKQGRVHHCGGFEKLESQMTEFETGFNRRQRGYSPDRLDALVHGLNSLLIAEREKRGASQQIVSGFWG